MLRIGGRRVRVWQLRIRDLGAMEAYAAERLGSPLEWLDPSDDDYARQLCRAYDVVQEGGWPPPVRSPVVQAAWRQDAAGVAFFLGLTLRTTPRAERGAIAATITPEELAAVEAIAWNRADDHAAAIVRAIDEYNGFPGLDYGEPGDEARPSSWAKAVAEAVGQFGWATPRAVGDLTLGEWAMARSGEPDPGGDPLPSDPAMLRAVEDARAAFFARFEGGGDEGEDDGD